MFKVRVIPCLDVKDGRVVKGVNFVDLRDAGDPVEAAIAYDAAGADELCFLDITASHENRGTISTSCTRTAEACFMPLTVGGGVRTVDDIRKPADLPAPTRSRSTPRRSSGAPSSRRRRRNSATSASWWRSTPRKCRSPARRTAGRSSPIGGRKPTGHRRGRLCARGGGARRRRNPARPRWTATAPSRLRHRADPRDRRRACRCR